MTVPFLDLKQQYVAIREEVVPAVTRVLESAQYILGSEVAKFEEEFADYCRSPYGVAVSSGTSALHLALLAAGVGPGHEVITVPCTFVATAAAITYTGARPVFIDVDPITATMDPTQISAAITPRTRAIIPVHLYGHPADMDPILNVARRNGLVVIEDAAQAHGAEYRGRRCGSIGDFGCFSFYPGKNLGACGEGGLVTTADPTTARTLRMLRDWGAETKYEHLMKGFNYRMDAVQGSILRIKLRRLEQWTSARRSHAQSYNEQLASSGLRVPVEQPQSRHVYHIYAVLTEQRRELMAALGAAGIQTGIHYPTPVHLLPAYSDLGYGRGAFPISERIADQELSLPMFAELTAAQIAEVTRAALEYQHGAGLTEGALTATA